LPGKKNEPASPHVSQRTATDVISQLAREMDLSPTLARQYARQQQSDERDEGKSPEYKQVGKPPLFRLSNHTGDCGEAPAADGDEPGQVLRLLCQSTWRANRFHL